MYSGLQFTKDFYHTSLNSLIGLVRWMRQLVFSLLSILRHIGPVHFRSFNVTSEHFPWCLPFHHFWFNYSVRASYHFMHSKSQLNFWCISELDHYPFPNMKGNSHQAVKGLRSLLPIRSVRKAVINSADIAEVAPSHSNNFS